MEFFTIGVFNKTEQEFFDKLANSGINFFCDTRQKTNSDVEYAFVNSDHLQERLKAINIKYLHIKELAPTSEIRRLQKEADIQKGETNTNRTKLAETFVKAYKDKVLSHFDFDSFIKEFKEKLETAKVAVFCVEEYPTACHRGLVAEKLEEKGYKITHL